MVKIKSILSLAVIYALLSACSSEGRQISSTPPSTLMPMTTDTITQTKIQPTRTPDPTKTPIPTRTPIANIEFPKWVSDANLEILLLVRGTGLSYKNLALANPSSGEIFNLPSLNSGGYFWTPDGKNIGLISRNKEEIILVNLATGDVSYHSVNKQATRFIRVPTHLDDTPSPFKPSDPSINDPEFMLFFSWDNSVSADGHYLTYQEQWDERFTSVLDLRTKENITVTDRDDGIFDISYAWSPTGPYLGIVQNDEAPGMWFSFEREPNFILKIYDIEKGVVIGSYANIPNVIWSPDGTKFLYQPWDTHPTAPPCIFDIISGATKCYNGEVVRHTSATTIELTFGSLQWSPDGEMISYIYTVVENNPYDEYGGVCLITVSDSSVRCMLEELPINYQKAISYQWSPNSDFLVFRIDESCYYCDYATDPQIGILDISTGEYFIIGDHIDYRDVLGLWRPKIKP
jgi:hypothetical protein